MLKLSAKGELPAPRLRGRPLSRFDGSHQLPRRFIAAVSVVPLETCRATRAAVAAAEVEGHVWTVPALQEQI